MFWRAAIASPRLRRTGRCGRKRLRPSRKVSGQAPPARRTRGGRPLPVAARPAAGRTRRGRRVHSAPPAAHPLEPGSPTPARSGLIEAGYRGGGCSQGRLHNLELRARLRSQCNPAFLRYYNNPWHRRHSSLSDRPPSNSQYGRFSFAAARSEIAPRLASGLRLPMILSARFSLHAFASLAHGRVIVVRMTRVSGRRERRTAFAQARRLGTRARITI